MTVKTFYEAFDGKYFDTEEECLAHETQFDELLLTMFSNTLQLYDINSQKLVYHDIESFTAAALQARYIYYADSTYRSEINAFANMMDALLENKGYLPHFSETELGVHVWTEMEGWMFYPIFAIKIMMSILK